MPEPTEPAPFAAQYLRDGQPVCAYPTARCEPCMFGQHPGGAHSWAGPDEIEFAKVAGHPDPTNQRCGCDCTNEPELYLPEPPDLDEVPFSALEPCPICGAEGPCGYDPDGLPMIHTDAFDEDTDGDQVYRPIEDVQTGGLV